MKIALVSFLFDIEIGGGAAAAARMLAAGLVKRGFEVIVITTHANRQTRVERSDGLTIFRFFPRNLYWVGVKDRQPVWKKVFWQLVDIWNPFAYQVVRQILSQERPDIVHIYKLRGLSPAVWTAARSAGIGPVIQTCQDYELMSPEGVLAGRVGAWAWQRAWFLRPYQIVRAGLSQTLTAATAPSHFVLDTLEQCGFFKSINKFVIPNSHGLTLDQLEQYQTRLKTKPSVGKRKVHLLYLGRLEVAKGAGILCEAFVRCVARFPNLHLNIAGWGALAETWQRQYGHHPCITFHGPVFDKAKSLLFESCDILVVPSLCPEAFGIVIAEAYAHGLPVIAFGVGGIPELVQNERTGFLVPAGEMEALVEVMSRVAKNPDAIMQMTPACLAMGRQFATEIVNTEYLSVYKKVSGLGVEVT